MTRGSDAEARLDTRAPFHLEATVRALQRRPANRVDTWEDGRYRRVLPTKGGLALVEVEDRGAVDAPDVWCSVRDGVATVGEVAPVVRRVLGLDADPEPLASVAEAEGALRPLAVALRGMRPPRFPSLFETFANVVPFQQVSLDAGLAVLTRIVERFGGAIEHEGRSFRAFPAPGAVAGATPEDLRACGLSVRKAETLLGLARSIEGGELTEARIAGLPTGEARKLLEALPGIGPWSASLVLLRGFGRLDVFPPGDVGVARGLERIGVSPSAVPDILARFGERRGYLYFFALAGGLLQKGLIRAAPPGVGT